MSRRQPHDHRPLDGDVQSWRVTGVFHREAGRWKAVQFHASEGVPNTRELTTSIEAVAGAVERAEPASSRWGPFAGQ